MDGKENARRIFEEQMRRVQEVTGKKTQAELAEYLGIRQSSVSSAVNRGKIPADWLVTLIRTKDVHPEWVLTGLGPCFAPRQEPRLYETGEARQEKWDEENALRRLSSKALADELVRRVALSQAESFTRFEPGTAS